MKKYKYILSDADNTLFDFDLAEHEALSETMKKFGVCLSETEHAAYHEINDGLWKKLERGEITREKLKIVRFSEFSDFLGRGIEASPEELAQEYVKNLALQSQLVPGALEFCRNTSAKYPLYLITNGITHVQRSRLAGSPIADYFTGVFISEEMGCAKPDVTFFKKVQESIGDVDLSSYLVIGDSLSSDIQGAVNFGCDSVWISKSGKSDPRPTYTVKELSEISEII